MFPYEGLPLCFFCPPQSSEILCCRLPDQRSGILASPTSAPRTVHFAPTPAACSPVVNWMSACSHRSCSLPEKAPSWSHAVSAPSEFKNPRHWVGDHPVPGVHFGRPVVLSGAPRSFSPMTQLRCCALSRASSSSISFSLTSRYWRGTNWMPASWENMIMVFSPRFLCHFISLRSELSCRVSDLI